MCVCVCVCVKREGRGGSCGLSLKLELDTRAPCLPRFILLISFSDTLLVVSIVATFVVQKGLLIVPVGTRVLFNLGSTLLRLCVCVSRGRESFGLSLKSGARHAPAPCFPRFLLLVSFRDTFLVVSISDIVNDCHLWPLLQS